MAEKTQQQPRTPKKKAKLSHWRWVRRIFLVLILLGIAGRLALPHFLRDYVNRTLDKSQIYRGKIGDIDVHLWRGAYAIHDIRLVKLTGDVPVPLFSSPKIEFAIQWNAILHGKLVGVFRIEQPEVNFVDAPDSGDSQTGSGGPWLQIIQDLFPFKINSVTIVDGSIHFRSYYKSDTPVDIYLDHLDASVDNLTNIRDETTPLLTTIEAKGLAMDQGKFQFKMKLDPFSYRPTFHMAVRLIGLDVTKLNDLSMAYGGFDFKRGYFDLVLETDSKEGAADGYIKPLFRDMIIFHLPEDIKQDNPLQFIWQALIGGGTRILTNLPRDQFGTLVPFHVDENNTRPNILATIGNVLRNAFVRAYLPKLQNVTNDDGAITFDAPTMNDTSSIGETE